MSSSQSRGRKSVVRKPVKPYLRLNRTEFHILKKFESHAADFKTGPIFIAVSGGADSLALLQLVAQITKRVDQKVKILHFNHGKHSQRRQSQYREKAEKQVRAAAKELKIPFRSLRYKGRNDLLLTESQCRNFRIREMQKIRTITPDAVFVFAHHQEDLLETRLLRLMRGTSREGLRAMTVWNPRERLFRPALDLPKRNLRNQLKRSALAQYLVTDPSNSNLLILRNGVRKRVIPLLEELRPGSVAAISASLESFLLPEENSNHQEQIATEYLAVTQLRALTEAQLKSTLKRIYMKAQLQTSQKQSLTRQHYSELQKRLKSEKRQVFELAGAIWSIHEQIEVKFLS